MTDTPIVETPRLRLRAHRRDDLAAAVAMWSDPAVTRYIGGKPSSEQQTWSRLLQYRGHWELLGFGYWAVEERATGDFVGELGFADFKREIAPVMRDVPELGWAFAAAVHGRGFATEAVRAAVTWGDDRFACGRTVCLIDVDNRASLRVADKAGYREFARASFNNRPTAFCER